MDVENFKTLAEIAATLPGRPHVSAIWRWCRKGIKARNGEKVKLAHTRIGGKIFICEEDLEAFLAALTAADMRHFDIPQPLPPTPRKRTEAQRRRAIDAANKRLAAAGI